MKYGRLLTRLYNTPLAIAQSKLDVLTSEVTLKLLAGESLSSVPSPDRQDVPQQTSVIRVFDSLVSKNGGGDSGSTSYESITNQINSAISNGSTKLTFYIDSPGGEVNGLFGLAAFIASLPSKGIETEAVTDGSATSAAYVIASACQTIHATESSILGSIGVIMTLINVAEADKKAGIEYTILRSKEDKALINPHEPLATKAIEDATKMLSVLDNIMNKTVSENRPTLSMDTIMSLAGGTVLAEEALSLGLIDGIVTSANDVINSKPKSSQPLSTTTAKGNTMTLEEALAKNIQLSSELDALKASTTLEVAKAKQAEQTRVLGILDAAATFKLSAELATKRIKAGASIEDTVEMFEGIKEALQMANPVDTATAMQSSITTETVESKEGDFLSDFMSAVDKFTGVK